MGVWEYRASRIGYPFILNILSILFPSPSRIEYRVSSIRLRSLPRTMADKSSIEDIEVTHDTE
jgi:hypothetical protein